MPKRKKLAATRPTPIQKIVRSTGRGRPSATLPPRIRSTVSARPTVPANSGV